MDTPTIAKVKFISHTYGNNLLCSWDAFNTNDQIMYLHNIEHVLIEKLSPRLPKFSSWAVCWGLGTWQCISSRPIGTQQYFNREKRDEVNLYTSSLFPGQSMNSNIKKNQKHLSTLNEDFIQFTVYNLCLCNHGRGSWWLAETREQITVNHCYH